MKHKATILLGTNLGDKSANLEKACKLISQNLGFLLNKSSIYITAAWGKTDQSDFLNQIIEIETTMPPQALLNACIRIEIQVGRVRKIKWGERIIDIDILYFDNDIIRSHSLMIPHPGIQHRRFTLVPLNEIAPDNIHPILNKTHKALLRDCDDTSEVELYLGQN